MTKIESQHEKVLVLDAYLGVKIGGRFDGWLMRRGGDGQWVTVRKLPEEGPYDNAPDDVREMFGLPGAAASEHPSNPAIAAAVERAYMKSIEIVSNPEGESAAPPQAWVERAAEIIIDEIGGAPDGLAAAWDAALRIHRLARDPDPRGEADSPSLSPGLRREVVEAIEECARVADTFAQFATDNPKQTNVHRLTATDIADAIRALSAPPAATDREDDDSSNGSEAVAPSPPASDRSA